MRLFIVGVLLITGLAVLSSRFATDDDQPSLTTRLQARIAPLLSGDEASITNGLRSLGYADPLIELVAFWQKGDRVFPATDGMLALNETRLLTEASPEMSVLRQSLAGQTGVLEHPEQGLRVYLSSGPAWLYCYNPTISAELCLVLNEQQLQASGEPLPLSQASMLADNWQAGLAVVLAAFLVGAGRLLYQHWLLGRIRQRGGQLLHDLRLPLTNIGLYLTLLKRAAGESPYLTILEQEQRRVAALSDELAEAFHPVLPTVRLFRGTSAESLTMVTVQLLLQQRLVCWQPALQQAGIELDWQIPDRMSAIDVTGSTAALERLLDNLLDNTCRHARRGRLYLRLQTCDQGLQLRWLSTAGAEKPAAGLRWRGGTGLASCRWLAWRFGWHWQQQSTATEYRLQLTLPIAQVNTAVSGAPGFV